QRPPILKLIFDSSRVRVASGGSSQFAPPPRPADFIPSQHIMKAQPYGFHFVMRGLARIGEYQLLIDQIRDAWGSLLREGATAFWGNWDRNNTLAAGWASTPLYDLSTDVLGVRP